MSKETSAEIAKIAAKILASNSFSKDAKRVAASCLSQREDDESALLIDHVREYLNSGAVIDLHWRSVLEGDLKRIEGK